jgi:hypothetical protein
VTFGRATLFFHLAHRYLFPSVRVLPVRSHYLVELGAGRGPDRSQLRMRVI